MPDLDQEDPTDNGELVSTDSAWQNKTHSQLVSMGTRLKVKWEERVSILGAVFHLIMK